MTQYLTTSCYKKRPPKKILIPASLWSGWRNPSKREGSSRQITTWLGKQTKGDKTTKLWEQDVKICIFQTLELFSDWGAVARHGGFLHLLGSRSLHQVCGLWSCLWTDCPHTHQEIQVCSHQQHLLMPVFQSAAQFRTCFSTLPFYYREASAPRGVDKWTLSEARTIYKFILKCLALKSCCHIFFLVIFLSDLSPIIVYSC